MNFFFRKSSIKKITFEEAQKCKEIIKILQKYKIQIYINHIQDKDSRYILYDVRKCDIVHPTDDKFNNLKYDFYLHIYDMMENPSQNNNNCDEFIKKYNLDL